MGVMKQVQEGFREVIIDVVDVPVVFDYQGGPEPVGEYGTVGLRTLVEVGDSESHSHAEGEKLFEVTKQLFLGSVTISFLGDNSYDNAMAAQARLKSRHAQYNLYQERQVAVKDVQVLRRDPEQRETKYIEKTLFTVTFYTATETSYDIDWFDSVDISGQTLGASKGSVDTSGTVSTGT